MSEQEPNTENLLDVESKVEANPQIKLLIKSIAGIFLFLSVVTILLCIGLLVQEYLTNHIAYEESIFKILDINFGIQEFYSLCFKLIGCLLIAIIPLTLAIELRFKKTLYVLFFMASLSLLTSFVILLDATRLELSWWKYSNELLSHLFIVYVVLRSLNNSKII